MTVSLILASCVPLALFLMTVIFYLKRDSLTHWEFSLSVFKGIHFSSDFVSPQQQTASPAEKRALAKQPIIAENLLQQPEAEKPARAKRGKSGNPAQGKNEAGKQSAPNLQ